MKCLVPRSTQCLKGSALGRQLPCMASRQCRITDRGRRPFHSSVPKYKVIPYLLADIGEGITECQVVEWFVKPGSRVEQFDKICEVQSDKASVEITSRFDGTIKALHYGTDDMAIVGKPLVDIDIEGDAPVEDAPIEERASDTEQAETLAKDDMQVLAEPTQPQILDETSAELKQASTDSTPTLVSQRTEAAQPLATPSGKGAGIATPAVRHLLKQLNIDINDVPGTGKDGRVRKEDIDRYMASARAATQTPSVEQTIATPAAEDRVVALSNTERQMFKVMTQSLTIPHFLYTHSVNVTSLNQLRTEIASKSTTLSSLLTTGEVSRKITALPFIMKAISHSFQAHPKLNAHLDTTTNPTKPQIILKGAHNFGIAVDTPQGLLVPVVRNVERHSIISLTAEIDRISELAKAGKLSPDDYKGATFTLSNVGSIGGGVVSPVIVAPAVAIVGIGRARKVPAFETNADGEDVVVKKDELVLSWSADHRVLDGATVARCAEAVGAVIENIQTLGIILR